MARRAFIVVLDAVGAGELPDAAEFGDEGSNTLGNVARAVGGLRPAEPPGARARQRRCRSRAARRSPSAPSVAGRLLERSRGKDTTVGHWEMAGVVTRARVPDLPARLPARGDRRVRTRRRGRGVIGNVPASGTEIIERLGEEHQRTGQVDRLHVGRLRLPDRRARGDVPLEELYAACRTARGLLTGEHAVGRVIARPFEGEPGAYRRTAEPPRLLARAARGRTTSRASARPARQRHGRRQDRRHLRGLRHRRVAPDAVERRGHSRRRSRCRARCASGLVFVNLVETDMTYGHRNDPEGFHRCLQEIDARDPRAARRARRRTTC